MTAPLWQLQDRRALAELRFVGPGSRPILTPVLISAERARWIVTRPGRVVVLAAPGLEDYGDAFYAPTAPAVGAVALTLDLRPADPAYGTRRFALRLPRDPAPEHEAEPDSVFRPVQIPLLPTPNAVMTGLVAALRVQVTRTSDGHRVEGALVRLRPEGDEGLPQARALTDAGGDALLLIAGVPLASPGAGGTVRSVRDARLDVIVDPALARFHGDAELDEARWEAASRSSGFIDPDDLEDRLGSAATAEQTVQIAAGRTRTAAVGWVPP
jgi:hypothetical protein